MSRLAKKLITIPEKVKVEQQGDLIIIKSGSITLQHKLHHTILIQMVNDQISVLRKGDSQLAKAIQGTTFIIISNHIKGVTEGFVTKLQLHGVGYKAKINGNKLELNLGKSHPIEYIVPEGIKIDTPTLIDIIISGADKQLVGQVAANIRRFRAPEPYKGKGVRYANEVIQLKETKTSKK